MGSIITILVALYVVSKIFKLPQKLGRVLEEMTTDVPVESDEPSTDSSIDPSPWKEAWGPWMELDEPVAEPMAKRRVSPEPTESKRLATPKATPRATAPAAATPILDSIPPRQDYLCSEPQYTEGKVFVEGRGYVSGLEQSVSKKARLPETHALSMPSEAPESISVDDLRESLQEELPKSILLTEILQRKYF